MARKPSGICTAAGMLFTDYGGVIGTMEWSISAQRRDSAARRKIRNTVIGRMAPLHDAIGRLRESRTASFDEWIPFIHVGL
ncbi:hypothetical protein L210DRAFT_3593238 [Boletus edulis BED1]|uniref:Uncharacterized protein n=1 Tax=Boletus edulis BED1 TaxID=1328754 RepID=A0AAD4BA01_BOLED|nr:hypothetical protein L210DRAFT_3593238 [Boletus edulis BED1]